MAKLILVRGADLHLSHLIDLSNILQFDKLFHLSLSRSSKL